MAGGVRFRIRPGDDPAARGFKFTRDSVASYFDRDGVMRLAPAGTLRTNYVAADGTEYRNTRAFTIEGERTNYLINTAKVAQAAVAVGGADGWLIGGTAVVVPQQGGVLAPDGSPAPYLQVPGGGGGVNQMQGLTPTGGTPGGTGEFVTFSIWLKEDGTSSWLAGDWGLKVQNSDGYTTHANGARIIDRAKDGWFRVAISRPAAIPQTWNVALGGLKASGTNGIFFWGPQLEQGAFASSTIISGATKTTRASDVLTADYPDIPESLSFYARYARPVYTVDGYAFQGAVYTDMNCEPSLFSIGDLPNVGAEFRAYFQKTLPASPPGDKNWSRRPLTSSVRAGTTVTVKNFIDADVQQEVLTHLLWDENAGSEVAQDVGAGLGAASATSNSAITKWAQPVFVLGRSAAADANSFFGDFFEVKLITGNVELAEARKLVSVSHSYLAPWMYNKLPEVVREHDRVGNYALQQMLSVLSIGFAEVHDDIVKFAQLIDPETCEEWALPRIAAQLGFEFPYDIPVSQQRPFVRFMVSLYRVKGTPFGMKLAALRLVGNGFNVAVVDEDHVAKTFTVEVTANGDSTALLTELTKKLNYIVTQNTPAGMIGVTVIIYYFLDNIDKLRQSDEPHTTTEYSLSRWSVPSHRLADNMKYAEYITVTLTI